MYSDYITRSDYKMEIFGEANDTITAGIDEVQTNSIKNFDAFETDGDNGNDAKMHEIAYCT